MADERRLQLPSVSSEAINAPATAKHGIEKQRKTFAPVENPFPVPQSVIPRWVPGLGHDLLVTSNRYRSC